MRLATKRDTVRHTLSLILLLTLAGCCTHPKPKVTATRPDGCYQVDSCNWCCPFPEVFSGGQAYSCTLVACVKKLP